MTYFVVCDYFFLLFGYNGTLSLGTCNYGFYTFFKVFLKYNFTSLTYGTQCCFIDNIGKLGT